MTDLYVGLMSGTSMDGIDAVVVDLGNADISIRSTHSFPYPDQLKKQLLAAIQEPLDVELDVSGDLDREVGACFRDAALAAIREAGVEASEIVAIGSHGQTLRHQPNADNPFSLQIGNGDTIATGTGIRTVTNFRAADIAAGGQGAPLVPPFHHWLFHSETQRRAVVNIGGIANITHLTAAPEEVFGFDTGPGNGLMDGWTRRHRAKPFDMSGEWAASGSVVDSLLGQLKDDPYFRMPPPKSTGFEYFNMKWLGQFAPDRFDAADVQATLCELSATTIAEAIADYCGQLDEIYVCGGGINNRELMRRLSRRIPDTPISSTRNVGLHPDWVEAAAFAWLAMRNVDGQTGNLPSVTGASQAVILGELHYP